MTREMCEKKERQKEAARLRRQRKPKPDAFTKWTAQSAKFFELPTEIRHEIYRLVFLSMTDDEDGFMYVCCDRQKEAESSKVTDVTIKTMVEPRDVQILPILQTCKQIHHEAKQVFWSSMVFSCDGTKELRDFCEVKQLPHRRPKKTLPKLFPVDRIRHLQYIIYFDEDCPGDVLESLWTLAMYAHSSFEPEIFAECLRDYNEHKLEGEGAAFLAIYRQIKEYQAWRGQQQLPLNVDRFKFRQWVDWDTILDFYARMPKTKEEDAEFSFK